MSVKVSKAPVRKKRGGAGKKHCPAKKRAKPKTKPRMRPKLRRMKLEPRYALVGPVSTHGTTVSTKGMSPKAGNIFWVRLDVQFRLDECVAIGDGDKTWTATVVGLRK